MTKELFAAVQQRLAGVSSVKYVSEDWGQLDRKGERPAVKFPCALYDLERVAFTDDSAGIQQSSGTIVVRVADYRPARVSAASPESERELRMMGVLEDVYKALHGLEGEGFSKLSRTSLEKVTREDSVREYIMSFGFSLKDYAAQKVYRTVEVGRRVTVTTKKFD